ncbi:four-carbon acid sugar kinase family protein [Devosia sp. J2-20]|jgi:3-dehydrotetronate 4-kinase|uniref:3-oxo-tetronate kinase n=1 Tax=Devosia sp. J2-20 TaxID=3026161 RepID=UPI002499C458|nr:3-oxo-tetronate kinase [Devosia sp. J2-20]WDQ99306.1 four-carbon acid sugar kinase family protein [Devosia sp. J2-20]
MRLGVIADDFTGASDIANVIARTSGDGRALRVAQYFALPQQPADDAVDVGVVSLKFRSLPAQEAVAQALSALKWLQAQGASQIIYKYCSTFDSTPAGNIGPVGEALAAALQVKGVVACPAFPQTGRTVYQGHLFVQGKLLHESGLENHPLNPMTDAYLPRWLAQQTQSPVGLIDRSKIVAGAAAVAAALGQAAAEGQVLVIADAIDDGDLEVLAQAVADAPLVTGGSAIAAGLARAHIRAGGGKPSGTLGVGIQGPAVVLAGSCSRATREQVAQFSADHPALLVEAAALMGGRITPEDALAFVKAQGDRTPIIYSSVAPDLLKQVQTQFGGAVLAERLDRFFADTARLVVANGVRRLVVAGGETSGAVASSLGLTDVEIGPEIAPGVPVLVAQGETPLALALKSGNFGTADFFARALDLMAHPEQDPR